MNKLAKNYIYNLLYQIFVIIVPLITMPYLARVLHSDNLGIYSYVTSCASIINTVGLIGLYNYGNRQVAYTRDNYFELNSTFSEIMSIRIVLCIFASIIYFVWAFISEYTVYFIIYFPWLLTGFIDISWFFAGIENMGPMVLKNFLIKLLNVIFIFVFVKNENDLWKYFALISLISLLANLSMYIQLKGKIEKFNFSLINCKKHLLSALLLFLPQLASLFYLQVDKVMLKWFTGDASQVAFYDQAEKIVNIPFTVVTALSVVMMPRIANEFRNGRLSSIKEYVKKSANFSMMVSIPILFGLDAIADKFIPWYLGNEYLPVVNAIWIISPIIITNTLVNISGTQYLTAVNKTRDLTISNIFAAAVNIIINSILIPFCGFYGAAIATVFSSLCCVVIQLYIMNKDIGIFRIIIGMWRYCISALVMFIILNIVSIFISPTFCGTLIMVLLGIIVYFLLLFIFKDEFFTIILRFIKEKFFGGIKIETKK